ncbi:MAG TPA: DUF3048 domain-containing protein [Patescibacteria group bacterium]|nr:DUF3048 domain-containing protein [Patescibacteria group bacterium]
MIDNFKPVSRHSGSRLHTNTNDSHPTTGQEGLKELDPRPHAFTPQDPPHQPEPTHEPEHPTPKKKRFSLRGLIRKRSLTKKEWLIFALVLILITAGGVGYWYKFIRKPVPVAQKVNLATKKKPEKPTTEPSRLTGVQVDPELNKLPITGIMIENSPDARPQSGLKDGGVIFEAVAEGGITRFLTLYEEARPDYVGPIRSARPYFLDWILPFEGSLAHVGGSPDALSQIKALHVRDLDQFANSGSYTRVSTRYAPHNVYTSLSRLLDLENKKGFSTSNFTGFTRKAESAAKTPTATSIDLKISGFLYNAHYAYDPSNNDYKRSEGGKPHVDERSKTQLSPKVVIALVMPKRTASDGIHTIYNTLGSGAMFVFQDGIVTPGTWHKDDRKAMFSFVGSDGKVLALNPGQTWISIVGEASSVTYK